jgi:hypothetical protein
MLPDDILLEIFDFYVDEDMGEDFKPQRIQEWITLAHVCRRWRSVVFQSPRRLDLRLVCTPKTPVRDILYIWPPLPLSIFHDILNCKSPGGFDNIIAALEHNDSVCQIQLMNLTRSELKDITSLAAIHKPFSELTDLHLGMCVDCAPRAILPDSFLSGTAPRLQSLSLKYFPFPGLPKLLLSATHLVHLDLSDIPRSGYIPPEAMATSLSALTSLESLHLQFQCPRPRTALERRRPPPLTCSILPSLTKIRFEGTSEYLEEILARIDAPRLNKMHVYFVNQIVFDLPQLFQFVGRIPTLRAPKKGHIAFTFTAIVVKFPSPTSDHDVLGVRIEGTDPESEWQLLSLMQVCTSFLPPVSTLEDLYIFVDRVHPPCWEDDFENMLWLELLHPFAAVKNLYLCKKIVRRIAPALQELVGDRTTEVLPTLENIFLEGHWPSGTLQEEGMKQFVAARRLTSHPVAVSRWDREGL